MPPVRGLPPKVEVLETPLPLLWVNHPLQVSQSLAISPARPFILSGSINE